MSEKRRDNRNRILRKGAYQRADGRYRYRYIDEIGKVMDVYSWRLDKYDAMPNTFFFIPGCVSLNSVD